MQSKPIIKTLVIFMLPLLIIYFLSYLVSILKSHCPIEQPIAALEHSKWDAKSYR